ncbi:RNA polymerase recycling motor HelD [Neobacillus rhizophilus]|uniref:UvrD-helicase domain-containing protein n=1 Tax=Neobacillus rhizophilus TaxID=2833579 RepID=A0A942UBN1_9BACI|nr:RNA polymerase recycling motor HelD [Neobacillus rhizophilus]MBS4216098.1 UvrD-helicase domain-containing protein [Neobacillus rhizophilus]MBU8919908.1 UvrD-helicase domain-containing protein [Bacillus sp. FJAT-29953]
MKDLQDNDWELEQERVNSVVHEVDKKIAKLQKNTGRVSSDVLEIRKTFWEDVTVNLDEPDDVIETAASIKQQAELLSERERTHSQLDRTLKTLDKLKFSPYFGRIDFWEAGEKSTDQVYLGIASLMDEQDENFLIYDWRAPISSLYYDYSPGPAHYQTPEGTIHGEMELKRQFIIRFSEIKGMFDTGVTIGDEMLREVLGNNASTQMKSIVATIQREQNAIIRNERSKLLIVQGVAGSGKTSAAMQRVAYLLYRYRGTLKSENILLFSPNPLFNSYVATVLPELGEENMQQSTFQEYLNQRLGREFDVEDPFTQIEYLLSLVDNDHCQSRLNGIRFKASLEFKRLIEEYAARLSNQGLIFKDISFRGNVLISKKEIHDYFYTLNTNFSIPNRMLLLKEWLKKELKKWVKREQSRSWVEEEIQYLEKEDYLEVYKKLQEKKRFTEHSFDDFDQEQKLLAEMVVKEKFKPIFAAVKNLKFINLPLIYLGLFNKENNPSELPLMWDTICSQTKAQISSMVIPYEDATPYVYLQDLIEGRKSNSSIRHIFIDEAQDYTPFQFAFIKMLFPYSKVTLLGDFNQAIFSGATGMQSVFTDFQAEEGEVEKFVLTKTYRSTKEIVEFTREFIENGDKIEPFNRSGIKPSLNVVESNLLNKQVLEKIKELQTSHRTIAVICRTGEESKRVYEVLKEDVPLHFIEKGTTSYESGVSVIPSYLSKGIEFDAVILYDSSQYQKESDRKLFYTVCTRAMHELHLFATDGISPLMVDVPKNTYEIIG